MGWSYLPILKWKLGEKIALRNLTAAQWARTVPMIELLPIDSAPDVAALREGLKNYLPPIAAELKKSFPEGQAVVVDTRYVSLGYRSQFNLLRVLCAYLAKHSHCKIIPALSESIIGDGSTNLKAIDEFDEVVVRIASGAVSAAQVGALVQCVIDHTFGKSKVHTVIDQGALVGGSAAAQVPFVTPYLDAALASASESVTLAGGSFPVNLIGIKQGVLDLPRVEWLTWNALHRKLPYKGVRYADYSVSHPELQEGLDPKKVNPSVQIRYCTTDNWRLFKAGGFKLGAPNQYKSLCQLLLADPVYSGATFSFGDACYEGAATGRLGNGNPSSWRRDATNHHIAFIVSTV